MRPHRPKHPFLLCSRWAVAAWAGVALASALRLSAQLSAPPPQDPIMSLMASQPKIELHPTTTASAAFDPAVVRPGELAFLRVVINALQQSIEWPTNLVAPPQLEIRPGAQAEILQMSGPGMQPRAAMNYRVRASALGLFTVPEFVVKVDGKPVTVPASQLQVMAEPPDGVAPASRLTLALPVTNLFVGQAVQARVELPGSVGGMMQSLMQPQLKGRDLLVDQSSVRQHVELAAAGRMTIPTYVFDITFLPMTVGQFPVIGQGFTVGRMPPPRVTTNAPVPLLPPPPIYTLVESDPVELNVRPLPSEGELPGFTGAIGRFTMGPPNLATNTLRVGDPVKLTVTVTNSGEGPLARLVAPPPPPVPDWQVLPAPDFAASQPFALQQFTAPLRAGLPPPIRITGGVVSFSYTLIPLSPAARATPAIPFSYFDPGTLRYVDLTIPSVPVSVREGAAPADPAILAQSSPAGVEAEKELKLSGLTRSRGRAVSRLAPPQQQAWFPLVQLAPGLAFLGLWRWDRRRRYLELHPDILLRRRARRALRRQRRLLRQAAHESDARRFAAAAVNALRVACAPHYPAEPEALVGGDVLSLLPESERTGRGGAVVRRVFALTDATRFGAAAPPGAADLLPLQNDLEQVLEQLEQRL